MLTYYKAKPGLCLDKYGDELYDTVLVCLVCPTHKKVVLEPTRIEDKGFFFPRGTIRKRESWLEAASNLIQRVTKLVKKVVKELKLVDTLYIQLPVYSEMLTRVTFRAELTGEGCKQLCKDGCAKRYSKSRVQRDELAGPEVHLIDSVKPVLHEVTIEDVLLLEAHASEHKELLGLCGYTDEDVLLIYGDYLQHCFPSKFMMFPQFESYLTKVKLDLASKEQLGSVFRAFTFNQPDYLTFHEFLQLLGLAMVDLFNGAGTKLQVMALKIQPSPKLMRDKSSFQSRYYGQEGNFITEKEGVMNKSSDMFNAVSSLAHLRIHHQA